MDANFVFPEPTVNWYPLLFVAVGLLQYCYRYYLFPLSEKTIDELNQKSFLKFSGSTQTARAGLVVAVTGLVFFVIFNIPYIQSHF